VDLLLFIVGVLGGLVCLGLLVIAAVKKTPKKMPLVGLGICVLLMGAGLSVGGSSVEPAHMTEAPSPPVEHLAEQPEQVEQSAQESSSKEEAVVEKKPQKAIEVIQIEHAITTRLNSGDYKNTVLDRFAVNENMAADDGTYITLVYLIFDVPNSVGTGNEMMRMYSDDLVASLAEKSSKICEAAIFWHDEYNDRSLKYAYEYRNGGFYLTSKME